MKTISLMFLLVFASNVCGDEHKILSRKKRYLIFPEGSSLQLIFCLTMPVLGHSTIFTIGSTAALAWELPSKPFKSLKKTFEASDKMDKIDDVATTRPIKISNYSIKYFDLNGYKRPLKEFSSIKLSPAYNQSVKRKTKPNYVDIFMEKRPHIDDTFVHPVYHHLHRRTRRDLYGKIEKFLRIQSRDGRACLLKSVCEVSQISKGKGTFMQEIIKTILRVKPYEGFEDEDEYDKAANKNHTCSQLYPTCQDSLLKIFH